MMDEVESIESRRQAPGDRRAMKNQTGLILAAVFLACSPAVPGQEARRGHLLIAGGGVKGDNDRLYRAFIELAGGADRARIGILPTASQSLASSRRVSDILTELGVPLSKVVVIDISPGNAAVQAWNPAIVEQVLGCTGLFIAGGDQSRLTRALVGDGGRDTPALAAIRQVFARGGAIAGSSAGAAVLSERMLSASGLKGRTLDYGFDALDFGIVPVLSRRGLSLSQGFGFFRHGLIDQHINGYRGRLARLSRALIDAGISRGFGIDEDTALIVRPDGTASVIGQGGVVVVDVAGASAQDGPLGYRASGIRLSYVGVGDILDVKSGAVTVHPRKVRIAAGTEDWNGNELIPDVFGSHFFKDAVIFGLIENTSTIQAGVALRYNGPHGHGYRLTFAETGQTRAYSGVVDRRFGYTAIDVRVDIEPISSTLEPSEATTPVDLPRGRSGAVVQAISFRGIMPADAARRFRPDDPLTRAEFANVLCHALALEPGPAALPALTDVIPSASYSEAISRVVATGLLEVPEGRFRPADLLTREEAAVALTKAHQTYNGRPLPAEQVSFADEARIDPGSRRAFNAAIRAGYLSCDDRRGRPTDPLTRLECAVAVYRILGFPW
jgi:cyanophycinase